MAWTAEKRAAWAREWRAKNREHIREYDRKRRTNEREKRRESSRKRYHETHSAKQEWLRGIETFLGCFICGESQPHRLAWHHLTPIGGKGRRVTDELHRGGVEAALKEMKRCVLLCANCHKDAHYWRRDQPHGL